MLPDTTPNLIDSTSQPLKDHEGIVGILHVRYQHASFAVNPSNDV